MLRTNSKKARENIRAYIVNGFDGCNYGIDTPDNFHDTAVIINTIFRSEKYDSVEMFNYYHGSEKAAFIDWCAGLPSILDTCYYYNRSAVDDLAAVLEETETEKARYSESAAEKLLSTLIYNEIKREVE